MVSAIFFSELVRIEDPKVFSRHVELSVFTAALVLVPVAVGAWFVGGDLLAAVFASTYRNQGPIPGYVLGILATGVVAVSMPLACKSCGSREQTLLLMQFTSQV